MDEPFDGDTMKPELTSPKLRYFAIVLSMALTTVSLLGELLPPSKSMARIGSVGERIVVPSGKSIGCENEFVQVGAGLVKTSCTSKGNTADSGPVWNNRVA